MMDSQYAGDQREFYQDCKEDGGPCKILRPKTKQIDNTDPSSDIIDTSFWEGTNEEPDVTETFALFFPGSSNINPYTQCYIPAFGLSFEVVVGMLIVDAQNKHYQISQIVSLNPDGKCVIFYNANLEHKPDYSFNE